MATNYLGKRKMYEILKNSVDNLITPFHLCDYRKYHGCEWMIGYTPFHNVRITASYGGMRVRLEFLDDNGECVLETVLFSLIPLF